MYTPQQIDFIREYGNKELTEGCIIRHFYNWTYGIFLWHSNDKSAFDCHISYDWGNTIDSPDVSDIHKCILWHHVEWHDVFAKLKEKGHFHIFALKDWWYELWNSPDNDIVYKIKIDPFISPMEQPYLIEKLLKFTK